MFCSQCGESALPEAKFCATCGANLWPSVLPRADSPAKAIEPYFFATSTLKLILMSIFTFGIYELYWFYKNWIIIKNRTGEKMMPFWRAFFSPIWAYSFFKHINITLAEEQMNKALPIGLLAISYFILQALWRLPDPYWLIASLSFIPLIQVNNAAIEVNLKLSPDFDGNKKLSTANWAGIILGGLLFVLAIIGTLTPENAS